MNLVFEWSIKKNDLPIKCFYNDIKYHIIYKYIM